jgi:membrane glycosyltransferase
MIVFDADSIMTGSSLVKLVRLMESHPRVGILQAPPLPVNRVSLFGRIQQFAVHLYSAVFLSGLNFWQGDVGNYWGHNAIIRIQPFVEHCRLPVLPGKPPLGGSILSHDFVEAAFMRRAGWEVHLASELGGSYEEMPSTLLGYAARDRRWCQGNLQHSKLLFAPGLHFISRVHIWMGIMGYLASPLWLLMLALTTAQGVWESLTPHAYFGQAHTLFPNWPADVVRPGLWLFGIIMGVLLLPKFLGLVLHMSRQKSRRKYGGAGSSTLSALIELVVSTLLAPNLAWFQSRFVLSILMGSTAKWEVQDRGDSGTTWREAFAHHWPSTAVAIGWTCLLAFTAPALLGWFSPVLLGFLLGIPLSVWTSRASVGLWARSHNLFLIPEESAPPQIIKEFEEALRQNETRLWCEPGDPLARVLADAEVRELHLAMLPMSTADDDPLKTHHREGLVLKLQHHGSDALSRQEKRELLLHADAIQALCLTPTKGSQRVAGELSVVETEPSQTSTPDVSRAALSAR